MEQFVLVPASMYNIKSLNTQVVTELDLQSKEFFSCRRNKLSNSQTFILDGVENWSLTIRLC